MLAVPYLAGLATAPRAGWFLVPLLPAWLGGYLAFNAASGWLKAAPVKRARYLPPLLTYGAITGAALVATVALAGPAILWWSVAFVPLLAVAFWLAAHRRERALIGGAATVAAASLLVLVVAAPDPANLGTLGSRPWAAALGCFAYFVGTIIHIKSLLRERGKRSWVFANAAWHAGWTTLALVAAAFDLAGWWWAALFAVATVRSIVLPKLDHPMTPMRLGLVELALSASLTLGAWLG